MASTDLLAAYAAAHPSKPAVIEDDTVVDYATFNSMVNRWANALMGLGVATGDKVIWVGQNGVEVVTIISAGRKAGVVLVPMNYRLTPEESAYVIDNSDAVAVLFDGEQVDQLDGVPSHCPKVRHWLGFRLGSTACPPWAVDFEALVASASEAEPVLADDASPTGSTMIYTSGTTGKPKGTVRRSTDPTFVGALMAEIGYRADDVYLTTGPLYHSGPLGFMAFVQVLGGTVVVQRRFDPEGWLALVAQHRVTTTFSAPTPIRRVVDLPAEVRAKYDASSLARVVANAAPWPFELKRKYVAAFGDTSLWEVYGSTELGVNTVLRPEDQMRKPASCGRPVPLLEIRLYDDDGNVIEESNVPGELFVHSPVTFDTYYKDQEKFDRSRRGDFLSVGDVAYRDDEGFYYICDRKSDMIISGGMNIYPAEIEAVLVAHPAVADAAVFGIPSDEWGESVHAVVSLYPDAMVTDDDLSAFSRDHLAGYKLPRSFSRMDEIPRTASGKILKRELRAPYWTTTAT
jgi:fatty-acyl-CoA synthase/long-chain acyl-CoA synthetase